MHGDINWYLKEVYLLELIDSIPDPFKTWVSKLGLGQAGPGLLPFNCTHRN